MRKYKNSITRILFVFGVLFFSLFLCQTESKAVNKTAEDGIAWCRSKVGTSVGYNDGSGQYQCVELIQGYYEYLGVSKSYGNGCDYATNTLPSGWSRVYGGTPQKGDILVYAKCDQYPYGHVAIYESDYVTYHQNWRNHPYVEKITNVRYNGLPNPYWGYIRPNWRQADTQPPSISNIRVTDVTADGYTVVCDVSDNVGVTKAEFPSWNIDINRGEDANWIQGSVSGNTVSARISLSSLKSGAVEGNYLTDIYVSDAAGNRTSARGPVVYIDRTLPTLSDVKIIEQDSKGYIVECKASDDKAVDRVQFPTWTEANSQDDLASDWIHNSAVTGTKVGENTYRFRVNISEHNNEYGKYITHVYAFDKCGNCVCYPVDTKLVAGLAPQKIVKKGDALLTLYNEDYSWNDINALAAGMGSHLAVIPDQEKDDFIKDFVADQIRKYYYIGASVPEKGKTWMWCDDSEMDYTNWGWKQPDCAGDNEFYLAVTQADGKWNDMPSYFNDAGFIVETPLNLKADAEIEYDGKIYKFYQASLPYKVAQRFCEENGGSLVKIDSQAKNDVIAKQAGKMGDWTFFLGATDEKEEGTFVWQDGSPLTYQNWSESEPNNDTICGEENYVQMYKDGTWNDLHGWRSTVGFIGEFEKEKKPEPTPTAKPQETKAPSASKSPDVTKAPQNTAGAQPTARPQATRQPQANAATPPEAASENSQDKNTSDATGSWINAIYKKLARKKVTGVKVKKTGKTECTISWKKSKEADHYEVKMARNRTFTKGKKVEKRFSTSDYFWNLKKKKTYYFKVRAVYYNGNNGRYYYGKWSRIRKVKIK